MVRHGNGERLEQQTCKFQVLGLERPRVISHEHEGSDGPIAAGERAHDGLAVKFLGREQVDFARSSVGRAVDQLVFAGPFQQAVPFRWRHLDAGGGVKRSVGSLSKSDSLNASGFVVESSYEQRLQGHGLCDQPGNRGRGFMEFDMPAGFAPRAEKERLKLFQRGARYMRWKRCLG